jgi:hypothetical protein
MASPSVIPAAVLIQDPRLPVVHSAESYRPRNRIFGDKRYVYPDRRAFSATAIVAIDSMRRSEPKIRVPESRNTAGKSLPETYRIHSKILRSAVQRCDPAGGHDELIELQA